MKAAELIAAAEQRGAMVHTTRHDDGALETVQVIGLNHMTSWPLPVRQAVQHLTEALKP